MIALQHHKFIEKITGNKLHAFQKVLVDTLIFREIEEALGFELYDHQKSYILGDTLLEYDSNNRRRGLTTAHIIKLALSDGKPINLHRMQDYCDMQFMEGAGLLRYSRYYRDMFMFIRNKLEDRGFKVREVFK